MDITQIIIAGVILCLAGLAQSVVGFGYALFATPLLLLVGLPLPAAITLVATCSMCQALIGARALRQDVPWRISAIASGGRLVGLIVGVLLLKQLVTLSRDTVQLVVGIVLCSMVAVQCIWKPQPQTRIHRGWASAAYLSSGLLSGLCGMGGPPLVLWSMAQDWSARKTRGFLFAVLGALIPVQLILLTFAFGREILWYAGAGMLLLPLVFLGSTIGLRIGDRIEKNRLQRLAYAVLLVMGASAVAPALKLW